MLLLRPISVAVCKVTSLYGGRNSGVSALLLAEVMEHAACVELRNGRQVLIQCGVWASIVLLGDGSAAHSGVLLVIIVFKLDGLFPVFGILGELSVALCLS